MRQRLKNHRHLIQACFGAAILCLSACSGGSFYLNEDNQAIKSISSETTGDEFSETDVGGVGTGDNQTGFDSGASSTSDSGSNDDSSDGSDSNSNTDSGTGTGTGSESSSDSSTDTSGSDTSSDDVGAMPPSSTIESPRGTLSGGIMLPSTLPARSHSSSISTAPEMAHTMNPVEIRDFGDFISNSSSPSSVPVHRDWANLWDNNFDFFSDQTTTTAQINPPAVNISENRNTNIFSTTPNQESICDDGLDDDEDGDIDCDDRNCRNDLACQIDWSGTALWRGSAFEWNNGYDCMAGTLNMSAQDLKQKINTTSAVQSNDKEIISIDIETKMLSDQKYDYKYKSHWNAIAFNTKYIQVKELSLSATCDFDRVEASGKHAGYCKFNRDTISDADATLDLNENFDSSWLEDLGSHAQAHVVLRGFSSSYENIENMEDLSVSVALESHTPDSNNQVYLDFSSNFGDNSNITNLLTNSATNDSYDITFYYTVIVSDSRAVTADTISDDFISSDLNESTHYYEATSQKQVRTTDDHFLDQTSADNVFIGLGQWGFNGDENYEFRNVTAYASLDDTLRQSGTVLLTDVRMKGNLFRSGECFGTSEKNQAPNNMNATIFVCKDDTVCKASENTTGWNSRSKSNSSDSTSETITIDDLPTNLYDR